MSRNLAAVRIADAGAPSSNTSTPQWLDRRQQDQDKQQNRVRVRRYWPGKAPDWAAEEEVQQDVDADGANGLQQESFPVSSRSEPRRLPQSCVKSNHGDNHVSRGTVPNGR
jgi:hypothetical protein